MEEDRVASIPRAEEQLWRDLGRVVHALPRVLEEDMVRATNVTMTEFAVLNVLSEAPGRRMRMADLAAAVGLTASRITRVVNALLGRSLVVRERDHADGRGSVAVLTEAGLREQRAAQPQQAASARAHVLDHLPAESVPVLADALRRLAAALIP